MVKYFLIFIMLFAISCSDDVSNPTNNNEETKELPITTYINLHTYVKSELSDSLTISLIDSVYSPTGFSFYVKHNEESKILQIHITNVPSEQTIDIDYRSIINELAADTLVYNKNDERLLFSGYANYKYDQRHYVATNSKLYIDKVDSLENNNIYITGKVIVDMEKSLNNPSKLTLHITFKNLLVDFVDENI